jgi:DNA-directed RNA polymerase alpha subunit
LINNKNTNENNQLETKTESISIEPYTNIAIEEQLSVRAYNCLKAQINTVGDLLQYSPEKLHELKILAENQQMKFSTLKNKLGIILK